MCVGGAWWWRGERDGPGGSEVTNHSHCEFAWKYDWYDIWRLSNYLRNVTNFLNTSNFAFCLLDLVRTHDSQLHFAPTWNRILDQSPFRSVNLNSATLYDETDRVVCSLTGGRTVLQTRRDPGVDHWCSRVEPGGGESPATAQSHHQNRQQGTHSPEHHLYLKGWRWFCCLSRLHSGSDAGSVLIGFVVFDSFPCFSMSF